LKSLPLVLYGGDTCQEGTQLAIESLRREAAAIAFMRKNSWRVKCVITGAGIRPDEPHYPQLKDLAKASILEHFPMCPPVFTARKDGWGTFNESLALYDALGLCGANEIYICSSWYHLPRIRLIWWIIAGNKVKIHFVSAPSPRYGSLISETASFIKVFYSWYKWKHSN
jgi:hypothetical protein